MFDQDRNRTDRYEAPRSGAPLPGGPATPWTPAGVPPATTLPGAVPTTAVAREGFLTLSFFWMFVALLVSAAAGLFVLSNQRALTFVLDNFWLLFIAELAFVFIISAAINRIGAIPALALLFAYAILNGATISVIVLAYGLQGGFEGVLSAFLGSSAIFGAAAIYGAVTKRDLTSLGGILFMGLIGIVVVSLVNAFLPSGTLSWIIGVVGVVIFTALTAYDVQRINNGQLSWIKSREAASVVGALALYLDFVNLFLMLLRVFNSRD